MNGKQIVPKGVIELATQIQSPDYKNKDLPQNGLFWFVQNTPALQSEIGERVPKGSFQTMNKWLGEKNAADTLSQSVPNNITSIWPTFRMWRSAFSI